MNKCLIVIDCQKDFITGALANKEAKAKLPTIISKINEARENKISIINTTKNGGFNIEKGTFDVFYEDRSKDGYYCTVNHDKFPYLKDFFEKLVNIRIEKQDINLTDEEIKNVVLEIIKTNTLNSNKTR